MVKADLGRRGITCFQEIMCDMGKRGEVGGLTPQGAGWGLLAQPRDTDHVQSQVPHVTQGLGLWTLLTGWAGVGWSLPKSVWLLIHPMAFRDTNANSPEPTKDPTPEKKKNKPMMALCMDLGAAEYANSRPGVGWGMKGVFGENITLPPHGCPRGPGPSLL